MSRASFLEADAPHGRVDLSKPLVECLADISPSGFTQDLRRIFNGQQFQQELKALDSFLATGSPKNSYHVTWQRTYIKPRDDIRRIVDSRKRGHDAGSEHASNVAEGKLAENTLYTLLFFYVF